MTKNYYFLANVTFSTVTFKGYFSQRNKNIITGYIKVIKKQS